MPFLPSSSRRQCVHAVGGLAGARARARCRAGPEQGEGAGTRRQVLREPPLTRVRPGDTRSPDTFSTSLFKKPTKKHNLIFYSFYNRQSSFQAFFVPRLATGEPLLAVRLDFCVLKCLRKIWHDCLGITISCFVMQDVYAESAATCTRGQSISC